MGFLGRAQGNRERPGTAACRPRRGGRRRARRRQPLLGDNDVRIERGATFAVMPAVATGAVDLKVPRRRGRAASGPCPVWGCDLVTAVPLFRRAQAVTLVALFGGSKRLARNFGRFGSASCTRRRPRGRNGCGLALWYARAAAAGYHRAQYALAQLYAAGDGVPRNPATAEAWCPPPPAAASAPLPPICRR
jgi:hypothetical protein